MDDLTGKIFSRLTVTEKSERRIRHSLHWLCKCECGNKKWVMAQSLKSGATKSCGCLNDEKRRAGKHGGSKNGKHTPEYASWHSMKQRCLNPKNKRFEHYGGRGIKICQRWMKFENFLADMGLRPDNLSIERRNNNGNYCKSNCKWGTNFEQCRNTSRNRYVTFRGENLCIVDWAKRIGIKQNTLHYRLKRWTLDKALTTPRKH